MRLVRQLYQANLFQVVVLLLRLLEQECLEIVGGASEAGQ